MVGHGWALIATFIFLKTRECKFYRGILGLFVLFYFLFKRQLNFSGSFYFFIFFHFLKKSYLEVRTHYYCCVVYILYTFTILYTYHSVERSS